MPDAMMLLPLRAERHYAFACHTPMKDIVDV